MVVYDDSQQTRDDYEVVTMDNGNHNAWAQIAESTMPLIQSKMATANRDYTQLNEASNPGAGRNRQANYGCVGGGGLSGFQASLELSAKEISRKLIWVNVISLIVNMILALVAFYFAYVNNSSATSAFAADCVLDFISSAIVLWRYFGDDLSSVYRHAREQIACIYLGALFELSAVAIIIKATSDMVNGVGPDELLNQGAAGYDLLYLAVAATLACIVLTVFKCALYKTIRDNSILLDVINTLISTVFAVSIIMSQALININPSFWYLDPIISIVLALFMAAFGFKVIHQNFNILRPIYRPTSNSLLLGSFSSNHQEGNNDWGNKMSSLLANQAKFLPQVNNQHHFGSNLNASIEYNRNQAVGAETPENGGIQKNWQKSDYSSIAFI